MKPQNDQMDNVIIYIINSFNRELHLNLIKVLVTFVQILQAGLAQLQN